MQQYLVMLHQIVFPVFFYNTNSHKRDNQCHNLAIEHHNRLVKQHSHAGNIDQLRFPNFQISMNIYEGRSDHHRVCCFFSYRWGRQTESLTKFAYDTNYLSLIFIYEKLTTHREGNAMQFYEPRCGDSECWGSRIRIEWTWANDKSPIAVNQMSTSGKML